MLHRGACGTLFLRGIHHPRIASKAYRRLNAQRYWLITVAARFDKNYINCVRQVIFGGRTGVSHGIRVKSGGKDGDSCRYLSARLLMERPVAFVRYHDEERVTDKRPVGWKTAIEYCLRFGGARNDLGKFSDARNLGARVRGDRNASVARTRRDLAATCEDNGAAMAHLKMADEYSQRVDKPCRTTNALNKLTGRRFCWPLEPAQGNEAYCRVCIG